MHTPTRPTALALPNLIGAAPSLIGAALALIAAAPTAASAQIDLRVRADAPGTDERNLNGEYVLVSNDGTMPVDLSGWSLCDAVAHCFVFPEGVSLGPGADLRVHTGSGRDTLTAIYMSRERPLWANWADIATLRDRSGAIRARCSWDRGQGRDCSPP